MADNVLALHPSAARSYAAKVSEIRKALTKGNSAAIEAVALVRELICSITATPSDDGGPGQIDLEGDLAVML